LLGCLLIAGLCGGATDSLLVFGIAFVGLLVTGIIAGDIRT
jgi:hypothetical protein